MVYVITDRGVFVGKTVAEMNKAFKGKFDDDEFIPVGPDYVCKVTQSDIDFVQDKRKMSAIMFGNFFRQDNSSKLFVIINIFICALILFFK